ncbi:hypothetical protein CI102_10284 [Trichoderma harzianum]|uniref:Uncharacterized protein n=1 Tax=Trichoderma harzianum CBS 226.95 TaxID=983964 RepID=A0A2T3ZZP6_TRIHA|nr:hypothetical protein M431DRAFT_264902 [Trichoderma harzianum CBS 226.95]PKK45368.1 hypothetical protein CI102_10284 [Trichoderma harzianum]PTB50280.1 hypothetical protein M431DRAFT_264902 [Trichoderma harzianum CBS 226.95]
MPPCPPDPIMSPLPARPSMPAPYLFGWHLRALLAACLGSVALQASPPCDGALAGLGSFFSNRFVSPPRSSFFSFSSPSPQTFLLVSQTPSTKDFVGKVLSIPSLDASLGYRLSIIIRSSHSFTSRNNNKPHTTP